MGLWNNISNAFTGNDPALNKKIDAVYQPIHGMLMDMMTMGDYSRLEALNNERDYYLREMNNNSSYNPRPQYYSSLDKSGNLVTRDQWDRQAQTRLKEIEAILGRRQ